jgi:hypothetical protein
MNRHQRRASKARGEGVRVQSGVMRRESDGKWLAFVRLTLGDESEVHESEPYDTEAEAEAHAERVAKGAREIGEKAPGVRVERNR